MPWDPVPSSGYRNCDVSPPAIPCFLPRTDFPEVSEVFQQDDSCNEVFQVADAEAAADPPYIFEGRFHIFPTSLMLTFDLFSFEGSEDLEEEFSHPNRRENPLNRYGWVHD